MLATLPKSTEVETDYTFASTCLPTLKLPINLEEPWREFKEGLILILSDRLEATEIDPEILGLFNKLVYGLLEIRIASDYIELQATKNMQPLFFPMRCLGDELSGREDVSLFWVCLG